MSFEHPRTVTECYLYGASDPDLPLTIRAALWRLFYVTKQMERERMESANATALDSWRMKVRKILRKQ